MLKEKLEKIFKNDGNSKKKIENLSFFLIILVITVIAINCIWKDDNKTNTKTNDSNKKLAVKEDYIKDDLESRLEDILSNIDGVGNVKVLITYNETEELIPVYNITDKKSTTNETDSSGGTRVIEQVDTQEEVVYQNDQIITKKTVSPKIEGAIITASGASNSAIKANIIQAVEVATGLASHKIQVFERKV